MHKIPNTIIGAILSCGIALITFGYPTRVDSQEQNLAATAFAAGAVTITNGSLSDTQAKCTSAADGDTIRLPSGSYTWTGTLTINKAITLDSAGGTVIRDGMQSGQLFMVKLVSGKFTRITGIEIQDSGSRTNYANAPSGMFHVDGSNTDGSTFRLDHCRLGNLNGGFVFDTVIGVIDHNNIDQGRMTIYPYGSRWNGSDNGDGSWAATEGFGTDKFIFIEDNILTNSVGGQPSVTDAYAGARYVVRYNEIHDLTIQNHGTESTGRIRGSRCEEIYNNKFIGSGRNKYIGASRSGVVLLHDNTISGYWDGLTQFGLNNYRTHWAFTPWGGADGVNPWDVNEPNAFFTGTAAANSSGTTVTVSGANFTSNQWAGYSLRRLTDKGGTGTVNFSEISGNTSNSITFEGASYGANMSFAASDSLEIRRIKQVLDGSGRGKGSLVSGNPPTRPVGWNDQGTSPCYSWNNRSETKPVNFVPTSGTIKKGEHYFDDTPMPGYTPYTYPHPLATGGGTPPPATPTPAPTTTPVPTGTPIPTATGTPSGGATPNPVACLSTTSPGPNVTELNWCICCVDPPTDGFVIERGRDSLNFSPLATLEGGWNRYYKDTTAPAGTNYYRMSATNAAGRSNYAFISATQIGGGTPTPTPTPIPTQSPTPLPTATATATPTATATVPPTPVPSPTSSPPQRINLLPGQSVLIVAPTP